MKTQLLALIECVKAASDIAEMRTRLFPAATGFFEATRGALFLHSEIPNEPRFQQNPVISALREGHAPVHEQQVVEPREWKTFCSRADHGHVLVGPLVQNGELVGAIAFTRQYDADPFGAHNVADLSALCLHASTRMTTWQDGPAVDFGLSPRECEIAMLVAQGKTNAQIGRELFVSSETVKAALKAVFRKTGVASRAQLAALLARGRQS